jgi:uncharacterized protein YbjT (DUF2867 family)
MHLITGAAGLNGQAVVREFARRGETVRALVHSRASAATLEGLRGIEVVAGGLARPETLGPALDGASRVLLISSANARMAETQISFIDSCKSAGICHLIKFSGTESGIGFDPNNFRFTRMHQEVERYLERSGLAWTHLCPSQFMQVYLREARSIAETGELRLPLENAELSPVDVEDIAKVAFRLLHDAGYEGKRLEMTGPEALTMSAVAGLISREVGAAGPLCAYHTRGAAASPYL